MSKMVEYIIGLKDQFSAVAAKVDAERKKLQSGMDALGKSVNTAEQAINRIKPPPALAGMPGQFERAAAGAQKLAQATTQVATSQAKASSTYDAYAKKRLLAAENKARFEAQQRATLGTFGGIKAVGAGVVGGAMYGAVSAGVQGLNPFTGQADLERKLQILRFKGELTAAQQVEARNYIADVAVRIGGKQNDLLDGFTELIQAGAKYEQLTAKTESGRTLFEKIALGAKASGEPISALAENIMSIAAQARLPMGNTEEIAKAISAVTGVISIAPALSPDSTSGHAKGLYQIMGILSATKGAGGDPLQRLYEASALQNTLSKMGYKDSLGGQALKTIIQRIQNPTPQGQQELRAAGFDVSKVLGINPEDLIKTDQLQSQLPKGLGLEKKMPEIGRIIGEKLAAGEHLYDIKDFVAGALEKALPKKTSKDVKAQLKGAVERHFRGGGFDIPALLEQTANLPVEAMKAIFGMWRAAQGAAMTGPQAAQFYKGLMGELPDRAKGFEGAASEAVLDPNSFAFQLDKLTASWERLRNAMADAGALDAAAKSMEYIAGWVKDIGNVFGKFGANAKAGEDGMTAGERGSSMLREVNNNLARLTGGIMGEYSVQGAAGNKFTTAGFARWRDQFLPGAAPEAGPAPHWGKGLAESGAIKVETQTQVQTKIDPVVITIPPVSVVVTGKVDGITGQGSTQPQAATAPRGTTSVITVPGPTVPK